MKLNLRDISTINSDKLYQIIRDKIVGFIYMPGNIISETMLAEEYNTSRTTVRASLQRLESDSLLQIVPQRGSFVTYLNYKYIKSILYIRYHAEQAAAAEIMRSNIRHDIIFRMRELLDNCATVKEDEFDLCIANQELLFHELLFSALDNPYIWQNIAMLDGRCARYGTLKRHHAAHYRSEFQHLHEQMLIALETQNTHQFNALLHQYLYSDLERLRNRLGSEWPLYFDEK